MDSRTRSDARKRREVRLMPVHESPVPRRTPGEMAEVLLIVGLFVGCLVVFGLVVLLVLFG
jgi:hypothetical protein